MAVQMRGKLFRIMLTQAEMYDLGNIGNVIHCVLYDSGTRIAVDISAEVGQAPVFSGGQPYELLKEKDVKVLEKYLSGEAQPVKDSKKIDMTPCVTGFQAYDLIGDKYFPVRKAMVALKNAKKTLDDKVEKMRKCCLETSLAEP